MSKIRTLFCFAILLTLVGCGSKDSKDGKKGAAAAKSNEPSWAPFSIDAPKVEFDDTTADQTVDNGRMTLKLITDWKENNDRRGDLFVFLKGGKSYPTLIVQKPTDVGDIKDLDDSNKTVFLTDLTKTVIDKQGKKYVLDNPKLLEINGRPWAVYRVSSKRSGTNEMLDVVFLTTVANGRKYTLQLRAIEKKGNHDWPALLTMASGMSFGGDKKPADPVPMPEPGKTEPEKTEPLKEAETEPAAEK